MGAVLYQQGFFTLRKWEYFCPCRVAGLFRLFSREFVYGMTGLTSQELWEPWFLLDGIFRHLVASVTSSILTSKEQKHGFFGGYAVSLFGGVRMTEVRILLSPWVSLYFTCFSSDFKDKKASQTRHDFLAEQRIGGLILLNLSTKIQETDVIQEIQRRQLYQPENRIIFFWLHIPGYFQMLYDPALSLRIVQKTLCRHDENISNLGHRGPYFAKAVRGF